VGAARIAIVGAGPAGLTAALAARQLGLAVDVFEQAADFRPLGGGLLLQSNGLRVLHALGLLDALAPSLQVVRTLALEAVGGPTLARVDYRSVAIPYNYAAVVLRHDLQGRLLAAAERAGARVHFGHRCQVVVRSGPSVLLGFDDGREHEASAVVAGDGVRSVVRQSLRLPARAWAPGEAYLRGVAPVRLTATGMRELWGPDGRRFGLAPLPGDRTYFYCSAPLGDWPVVRATGLAGWLASWDGFGPAVRATLAAVTDWPAVSYSELAEVEVRRWWQGPVFLTGDAAHAMTPNLGQGANSAMVDALVLLRLLAPALAAGGDLEAVGRRYDALRRPFVTRIQRAARQTGALARLTSPPARRLRDLLLPLSQRLGPLRRRMFLLGVGYHPAEDEYLSARAP
jgi:salicylate hydroxylase